MPPGKRQREDDAVDISASVTESDDDDQSESIGSDDDDDDDESSRSEGGEVSPRTTRASAQRNDDASGSQDSYEAHMNEDEVRRTRIPRQTDDIALFLRGTSRRYMNALETARKLVAEFGNAHGNVAENGTRALYCDVRRREDVSRREVCLLCGVTKMCRYEVYTASNNERVGVAGTTCAPRLAALRAVTRLLYDVCRCADVVRNMPHTEALGASVTYARRLEERTRDVDALILNSVAAAEAERRLTARRNRTGGLAADCRL